MRIPLDLTQITKSIQQPQSYLKSSTTQWTESDRKAGMISHVKIHLRSISYSRSPTKGLAKPARYGQVSRSALIGESRTLWVLTRTSSSALFATSALQRRIRLFLALPFDSIDEMSLRARLGEIGDVGSRKLRSSVAADPVL